MSNFAEFHTADHKKIGLSIEAKQIVLSVQSVSSLGDGRDGQSSMLSPDDAALLHLALGNAIARARSL